MKVLLLLVLFASVTFGQLPDKGSISDLKGKTKVYVVATTNNARYIEKELKKTFQIVQKAADAEFFLEYKILSIMKSGSLGLDDETGQLDAYFYQDKTKVVAWSESASSGFRNEPNVTLPRKFVKAWKSLK